MDFVAFARDLTWRKFLVWSSYIRQQKNNPSRSDHYLMQINRDVVAIGCGKYYKDLDKFKITWGTRKVKKEKEEEEEFVVPLEPEKIDLTKPPPRLDRAQVLYYSSFIQQARINHILGSINSGI